MKKILSAVLALLCVLLFAGFALGSGEDISTVSAGNGEVPASQTEGAKTLVANVGDTLTVSNLKIVYKSCTDYTDYNPYFAPKSGNKVIKLTFDVENVGDADLYISGFIFDCYADGVAMEEYYAAADALAATVSPDSKTTGSIYFEIPENAEKVEVEFITANNKAIFVVK